MPKRKFSPEIAGFFTLVLVMSVLGYRWEKANFHWATIILAIFMYLVRGFSITVYYHRYATHKQDGDDHHSKPITPFNNKPSRE